MNEQKANIPEPQFDVERRKNPNCPYCFQKLIPFAIEHEDGSGWVVGWTCNCDSIKYIENHIKEEKIDYDYEYLGKCEYGIPNFGTPESYSDCGEPAIAKIWWDNYDQAILVCQEHFDKITKSKNKED
jgi:hypothetical protein